MRKITLGKLLSGEEIEWYLVDETDTEINLLSAKGLISKSIAKGFRRCGYDDSDLKLWLENQFLEECFTENEINGIKHIGIPNEDYIIRWIPSENTRRCEPSAA